MISVNMLIETNCCTSYQFIHLYATKLISMNILNKNIENFCSGELTISHGVLVSGLDFHKNKIRESAIFKNNLLQNYLTYTQKFQKRL